MPHSSDSLDKFIEIAENVYRYTSIWKMMPLVAVPVSAFLIKDSARPTSYYLIDALYPKSETKFIAALKEVMSKPDAELKYILVTHGHLDHINAIPSLQELFPACRIVTHSLEVPFLTGEIDYRNVKGDTTVYNCCRRLMQVSDVKVRRETIDCVDDSNKTFEFENDIKPVRTHGHTPGSMSWLHIPSQSIFVGDAMMNTISFMSPRSAVLQGPYVVSTVSKSDAHKSLEEIRKIEGWQTLYPAHDDGSGIPRKEFENFIEKLLKNQ